MVCLLGGGFLAALTSHALLANLQRCGAFGAAYLHHEHGAVAPLGLTVALLGTAGAAAYLLQLTNAGDRRNVIQSARAIASSTSIWPCIAIVLIALGSLAGIEALERALSGDDEDSWLSAFGSVPAAGMMIVGLIAIGITRLLRGVARCIADVTDTFVALLAILFNVRVGSGSTCSVYSLSWALFGHSADISRISGSRAPPFLLA